MNSKPWFSDGKRDIIKNPHNPHRVRCSINLYWQPVVRSSVFVYRNECLPQKQPCFPASAPVNSKMAGTDVTSYQSSSQKKSKRPHPGALILSQTPEGGEGKRGQMPHICPGSPLGLNIDRCIMTRGWNGSQCWSDDSSIILFLYWINLDLKCSLVARVLMEVLASHCYVCAQIAVGSFLYTLHVRSSLSSASRASSILSTTSFWESTASCSRENETWNPLHEAADSYATLCPLTFPEAI